MHLLSPASMQQVTDDLIKLATKVIYIVLYTHLLTNEKRIVLNLPIK